MRPFDGVVTHREWTERRSSSLCHGLNVIAFTQPRGQFHSQQNPQSFQTALSMALLNNVPPAKIIR